VRLPPRPEGGVTGEPVASAASGGDAPTQGERPLDAAVAHKGAIMTLYTAPPPHSTVVCIDEMGPVAAKSYRRRQVVRPRPEEEGQPAQRATQEAD
jgi:hypothetical protein